MNLASLFAGIGGLELAAQRAGIVPRLSVEIDPTANDVRRRHFSHDCETHHDVRTLTGSQITSNKVDILTAGWPCQGNSVAGRRAGMADARSSLWSEVRRLLQSARPRWFVGENVPGLLSVNGGRDFRRVLRDLAECGYGTAYRVLDAQNWGVAQRRRRVFLVGCLGDWRRAAEVLFEPESLPWNFAASKKKKSHIASTIDRSPGIGGEQTNHYLAATIPASDGGASSGMHPLAIAFSCKNDGRDATENLSPTLRSMNARESNVNGGGQVAVTVPAISHCLTSNNNTTGRNDPNGKTFLGVRRLTPLENERLQGSKRAFKVDGVIHVSTAMFHLLKHADTQQELLSLLNNIVVVDLGNSFLQAALRHQKGSFRPLRQSIRPHKG